MATVFIVVGALIGAGIGWLLGRRAAAQPQQQQDCNTYTWGSGGKMGPWSGAIIYGIFGAIIGALASSGL